MKSIKPLSTPAAFIFFAIPSAALAVAVYVTIPQTVEAGIPLAVTVPAHFILILGGLGVAALNAGRREARGRASTLERLRLGRPTRSHLALGLTLGAFSLGSYIWLSSAGPTVERIAPLTPPAWLADFSTNTHLLGIPLANNWWPVLLYFGMYISNVLGEELWWRGYILPRQELALHQSTWVVHGLLWDLFHWFFFWDLIPLLPTCLAVSFVAQRTGSTWPGIVGHAVLNAYAFVRIIGGVVGA